jgi:hypothetical protein
MPGVEPITRATDIPTVKGRWIEDRPIPAPVDGGKTLTFCLESSGASVSVQLTRRNSKSSGFAWVRVHSGPLLREDVRVDLADLLATGEFHPSPDDSLVLRFKALEAAGTVRISKLQFAEKEMPAPARVPGAIGPEGLRWPRDGEQELSDNTVLIFGTFDVENYGDLLFPLLAERRLAEAGLSITPVSPTDVATPFEDAPRPVSIDAIAHRNPPGKGVLIGGGNIVHLRPTALPDYQRSDLPRIAYPALWLGATTLAAAYDLPVAWNAPGVPFAESSWPAEDLLHAAAAAADYLSVRDEESRDTLGMNGQPVAVTPDTAVEVSKLWPLSELEPLARNALESRGFAPDSSYIAIHVKQRSLKQPLEELARALDQLSVETGKTIALVAIGACHGDDAIARRLGEMMFAPTAVFDHASSLRQIAAIIACAELVVCSSLHAYITSFSYGRPGILVAPPLNRKFRGFTRLAGRDEDLVFDWASAMAAIPARLEKGPCRLDLISGDIARRLDDHWSAIIAALSDRESGRTRRVDFLRRMTAINLRRAGWSAALSGLLSPE